MTRATVTEGAAPLKGADIRFTLREVAKLCKVKPQKIRDLVAAGRIEPAVRGRKGYLTECHRFTPSQTWGLMASFWKMDESAFWRGSFERLYESYASWPWEAMAHGLGLHQDDWTDEAFAKAACPEGKDKATPIFESDMEWLSDLMDRWHRFREAVRAKLDGPATDRTLSGRRVGNRVAR